MLQLYQRVSQLLRPWPHLVNMFTEFLEPEDCLEAKAVRGGGGTKERERERGVGKGGERGREGLVGWRMARRVGGKGNGGIDMKVRE